MKIKSCCMDKQTLREIGHELWLIRKQRGIYLRTVANRTYIPERVIEGMEIGKFIKYAPFRRLTEFYGIKMRIVFEENT